MSQPYADLSKRRNWQRRNSEETEERGKVIHCVAFTHLAVKDAHQNRDPKISYFLDVLASVFGEVSNLMPYAQ